VAVASDYLQCALMMRILLVWQHIVVSCAACCVPNLPYFVGVVLLYEFLFIVIFQSSPDISHQQIDHYIQDGHKKVLFRCI